MAMTFRQLSYFVALADVGSFGGAAERVHVSQPALSAQIRELEGALGVQLVERRPREIRLTRAGQLLAERARRVLAELRDMEAAVRMQRGLAGRLAIGVIPTIAPYLLPHALTRIRARDLDLDIRVREAQTAVLVRALTEGQLDAAVLSLPVDAPGLVAEPLCEDRFLLAGSDRQLAGIAAGPGGIAPTDLPADRLLLLDEGHCLADQALEVCGLARRPRGVELGAASLATLCGLVGQGFGLTLLPELAVPTESLPGRGVVLRRFRQPEPARRIALVRRAASGDAEWAAELAEILRAAGAEVIGHARRTVPA